jgi:hypothetical protein
VHLWMLATLSDASTRTRFVLAAVGLAPFLAVAAYYMWRLEMGPPRAAYYLLLLVTGNQTGLVTTAAGCALLAITASVAAILVRRAQVAEPRAPRGGGPSRDGDEPRPAIFGPGGHAGPGMLGGTGSAVGRR